MWKLRRDNKVEAEDCAHHMTHHSAAAGLERVICEVCHYVSIRYVEEVIADDIVLTDLPVGESVG